MSEPPPTLFLLGASHHTAPLALREKLALAGGKLDALRGELHSFADLREFAVLNTCNRVEIYGVAAQPETVARLQASFCAMNQMDPAVFEQIRLHLHGPDAIQHLLEVAAGVDSQMVGETELLGQVKGEIATLIAQKKAAEEAALRASLAAIANSASSSGGVSARTRGSLQPLPDWLNQIEIQSRPR